jgi:hypothetical protein
MGGDAYDKLSDGGCMQVSPMWKLFSCAWYDHAVPQEMPSLSAPYQCRSNHVKRKAWLDDAKKALIGLAPMRAS